jgi:sugar O-acyltransferase (sialic acid O-acetyltransferase NeuD family)
MFRPARTSAAHKLKIRNLVADVKNLVIFGTRQIAEVCSFYFRHDSQYRVVAHTVDRAFFDAPTCGDLPVIPFEDVAERFPPAENEMFVAIGYGSMNRLRAEKVAAAKASGYALAHYVSSKAMTWPGLKVGENSFVMEANVVQPFASIGTNTILWSGNHIGHHARIGDHCFLASHIVVSGNVEIGDHCFIGVNATLRDGIKVASRCLIGAGALLLKDTKPDQVIAPPATEASRAPSSRISP